MEVRIENVHFQAFSGGWDDQTTAWNCFIEFSWEVVDEPTEKWRKNGSVCQASQHGDENQEEFQEADFLH